jgi:NADP-dependent 3-hydroxy acid dehydrogenase YdfG
MAAEEVGEVIVHALGQPRNVTLSEILMRPANSPM